MITLKIELYLIEETFNNHFGAILMTFDIILIVSARTHARTHAHKFDTYSRYDTHLYISYVLNFQNECQTQRWL